MNRNQRQPHLCEIKDDLTKVALRILNSGGPYPKFKYALDELRCPHRDHCDPTGPCKAMQDYSVRQRLSEIDDEIFALGFVKGER